MKNRSLLAALVLPLAVAGCVLGTNAGDRLPTPATISLQVFYQESEKPVPEADVEIHRFFTGSTIISMGSNIPVLIAKTDAAGRFTYTTELNGSYIINVSKVGASVVSFGVKNLEQDVSFVARLIER